MSPFPIACTCSAISSEARRELADAIASPPLFPPFVVQRSVAFDLADEFPGIALPASLERAVQKRKAEFLAGRHCVREALRELLPERADEAIGIGVNHEPLWPSGIIGSITHAGGVASVALARESLSRGIAIDIECVVPNEKVDALASQIASREELKRLARVTGLDDGLVFTLVFSAKESIFKCLHRHVRRYFDFRDAEIGEIDVEGRRFVGRLLTDLTTDLRAGHVVEGRFVHDATTVATGMLLAS